MVTLSAVLAGALLGWPRRAGTAVGVPDRVCRRPAAPCRVDRAHSPEPSHTAATPGGRQPRPQPRRKGVHSSGAAPVAQFYRTTLEHANSTRRPLSERLASHHCCRWSSRAGRAPRCLTRHLLSHGRSAHESVTIEYVFMRMRKLSVL
jgi:hypothetical protein